MKKPLNRLSQHLLPHQLQQVCYLSLSFFIYKSLGCVCTGMSFLARESPSEIKVYDMLYAGPDLPIGHSEKLRTASLRTQRS